MTSLLSPENECKSPSPLYRSSNGRVVFSYLASRCSTTYVHAGSVFTEHERCQICRPVTTEEMWQFCDMSSENEDKRQGVRLACLQRSISTGKQHLSTKPTRNTSHTVHLRFVVISPHKLLASLVILPSLLFQLGNSVVMNMVNRKRRCTVGDVGQHPNLSPCSSPRPTNFTLDFLGGSRGNTVENLCRRRYVADIYSCTRSLAAESTPHVEMRSLF